MTGKPSAPGNWVYSLHEYNFTYATFSDGVPRHDDFGITLMNAVLNNARAWGVPLYIGEFTNFSLGVDARNLTDADMAQTRLFLDWAKQNGVSWTFWAYLQPLATDDDDGLRDQPAHHRREERARHRARRTGRVPTNRRSLHSPRPSTTCRSRSTDRRLLTRMGPSPRGRGTSATDGRERALPPRVTYPSGGTYTVTLTVTDNRGATASTSKTVTVTGPPGGLYASDMFSRTVTNGWGTAELGGAWSLVWWGHELLGGGRPGPAVRRAR